MGKFALTRGQVTKTAPLVEAFRQGKVSFVAADIDSTQDDGETLTVQLGDGTSLEGVDDIINATGYTNQRSILNENYTIPRCNHFRLGFT